MKNKLFMALILLMALAPLFPKNALAWGDRDRWRHDSYRPYRTIVAPRFRRSFEYRRPYRTHDYRPYRVIERHRDPSWYIHVESDGDMEYGATW